MLAELSSTSTIRRPCAATSRPLRFGERKDQQAQQGQLEQQGERMPQTLPHDAWSALAEDLFPEKNCRDGYLSSTNAEHVQRNQRHGQQQPQKCTGMSQLHVSPLLHIAG